MILVTEPEAAAIYTARYLKEDKKTDFLKASILVNCVYRELSPIRSPKGPRQMKSTT
jgi:hypothetical protein